MTYQSTVLADNPSSYWKLQETTGTTATDSSSTGTNTGTYTGTVTLAQSGDSGLDTYSVLLDGASGYIKTATSVSWSTTPVYSVEMWIKTSTTTGGFLSCVDVGGTDDFATYMDNTGHINASIYTGSGGVSGNNAITSTTAYNDGKWHQVVTTYTSGILTLYVDGASVGSGAYTSNAGAFSAPWQFGYLGVDNFPNMPTSRYFNGYLSDISVWNSTALTSTQVSNHYNAATSGSSPTPINATGAFQGQGSLSATANIVNPATINAVASFTGQGSLTAAANLISPVVAMASMQGQGTLTATGNGVWLGSASLTGQGSLSSNPVVVLTASASLSGQGSLTAVVELQDTSVIGTANFYGSSSVVSNPTVSKAPILATANMQGQGSLTATVDVIDIGVANLQGTSYLMANAVLPSQVKVPKVWNVVFDPKKSWTGVFDKTVHTWTGVFDPKKVWVGGE